MESHKLGNLEEMVLLLVGVLYGNAYSVSLVEEYRKQTGKNINISAIHTVLYRLEKKGLLESKLGESQALRGGKPLAEKYQEYGFKIGLVLLLGLMFFATINDIRQLIF